MVKSSLRILFLKNGFTNQGEVLPGLTLSVSFSSSMVFDLEIISVGRSTSAITDFFLSKLFSDEKTPKKKFPFYRLLSNNDFITISFYPLCRRLDPDPKFFPMPRMTIFKIKTLKKF